MAAKIEELDLYNAKIECTPLPYERAEDLLPDVAQIISRAFDQVSPQLAELVQDGGFDKEDPKALMALLPAISGILQQLGGGKLKALAPRLLATTTITLTNDAGEKERHDMVSKDDRARCFDARPDVYFPALFFAGKVTFARFFPGAAQRSKKPAPAAVA